VALLAGMPVITKPATARPSSPHGGAPRRQSARCPRARCLIAGATGDLIDRLGGAGRAGLHRARHSPGLMLRGSVPTSSRRRARERRGRQPQRRGARPGRRARRRHLGPLPRRRGARHDAEDRAEVHGHPPGVRARAQLDAVLEDLADRLAPARGRPHSPTASPWARSSTARSSATCARASRSSRPTGARVVLGGAAPVRASGRPAGKGYFVAPTLLAVDDGPRRRVHEHEVFGRWRR
jgi:hypothetical protein